MLYLSNGKKLPDGVDDYHARMNIDRILGLDSNAHDRWNGEFHDTQVVGILEGRDGTSPNQIDRRCFL